MVSVSNAEKNSDYFELEQYCETNLNINILQATQINRGWLNRKWKIETNQGTLLLKEYSNERYKQSEDINKIITALDRQQKLNTEGIACPRLITHAGQIMHITDNNKRFILMDFVGGDIVKPGTVNEHQLYALGCQTGKMHRLLNLTSISHNQKPQFIPPAKQERLNHWYSLYSELEREDKQLILSYVELQIKATEALDLALLHDCEAGYAHRDLWVDNILFQQNKLSAIVDFDRLNYDYPELDIARAILSCTLLNNKIQTGNVQAFISGYRTERAFPIGLLERALRMLWYLESTWWINNSIDQQSGVPARFAMEMMWLSEHHQQLHEMFAGI